MQFSPDPLAGRPDHAPKTAPGVAQRGHEQAGFTVALGAWHAGGGTFTVVDLHLLAGLEGQAVELFGLLVPQMGREAFDGVVGTVKAVQVDQILVDGRGVAAQA